MAALNLWLDWVGAAVGNHLWQSTAFAVVAWGATLLLRKNAAQVRYGVWLAASVKFLVPFSLLIGLGGLLPRPRHALVTMPVYSAVDEVGLPFSDVESVPVAAVDPTHAAGMQRHEWGTLAAGIWGCGVVVVLGVWVGRWRQVMRTLGRAVRVEGGRELALLRRVEDAMGRGQRVPLMWSSEWMEPGMFGVWRPVLIWPEGLSERLEDEHIEAILAHELMHARRRDNLTAALHMIVEAAFWFHPVVWWMERRMVEERERACDEAVVEMGSRPGVYAESLLKAVRFCVESPLVCVAGITGADLSRRVRSIMTLRLERLGVVRKIALAVLGFVAIAGPVGFGVVRMIPMYGQVLKATGPLPSYEVVVIKPAKDQAHGASTTGEQTQYLVTAKMLIQFAYGVYSPPKVVDLNVVGGPDWINTDVFDIVGKMESTEFQQEQNLGRAQRHDRRQLMEQSMLADRFKLKMHTEMRDEPVYALTVMKGMKLTPAKDATGGAHVNPYPSSSSAEELKRGLIVRKVGQGFEMTVKGMTLDTFVDALMAQKETAARQVVNQTGLTGAYDFTLKWGPEATTASDSGEVEEPGLFTAIQQQLGLKLAEGKGPAEVVVIDHIERPVFDSATVGKPAAEKAHVNGEEVAQSTQSVNAMKRVLQESSTPVAAQTPIRFDVISFRKCAQIDRVNKTTIVPPNGDSIARHCQSMLALFDFAFGRGRSPHVVNGEPDWVDTDAYDFQAKVAPGDVPAWQAMSLGSKRLMVRDALVERLNLKTHVAIEPRPVYNLVVAKGGPRVTPSTPDPNAPPPQGAEIGYVSWVGAEEAAYRDATMEFLANGLAARLDRNVVDKTGLRGSYDFHVKPLPYSHYEPKAAGVEVPDFTAIRDGVKDLGLELVPANADTEVLVVDHVERPSEN